MTMTTPTTCTCVPCGCPTIIGDSDIRWSGRGEDPTPSQLQDQPKVAATQHGIVTPVVDAHGAAAVAHTDALAEAVYAVFHTAGLDQPSDPADVGVHQPLANMITIAVNTALQCFLTDPTLQRFPISDLHRFATTIIDTCDTDGKATP